MSLEYFDNGLGTFCPDTPQNWAHFNKLKAQIQTGRPSLKSLAKQDFNRALQSQISKENKELRKFRAFLPGHGPNRF